jgi:integrase
VYGSAKESNLACDRYSDTLSLSYGRDFVTSVSSECYRQEWHRAPVLRLLTGERPGDIRDISFRNIRLEDKTLRLVGLDPQFGQKIHNIRFTDVAIESWRHDAGNSERSNYLDGNNGGSIDGVTFDNVMVGGQVLTQANSSMLGRLKASGDVSNITFRN